MIEIMWRLARSHPARCWLVVGVWAMNTAIFSQFAVWDSAVFYIPGTLAWALLAGFGAEALGLLTFTVPRASALRLVGAAGLAVWLVALGHASFASNDPHHGADARRRRRRLGRSRSRRPYSSAGAVGRGRCQHGSARRLPPVDPHPRSGTHHPTKVPKRNVVRVIKLILARRFVNEW